MLVYHPAFDNYHCISRILKILDNLPDKAYRVDRIKIYDYFLVFTNDLRTMTLPHSWSTYKTLKEENRYNSVQNPRYVFKRMSGFQNIALNALASYGLIDKDLLDEDLVKRTATVLEIDLTVSELQAKYFYFVNHYANQLSLRELKERSKLMDYKYELS